jgi:thiol-disulfide isomerase/thioredoxin
MPQRGAVQEIGVKSASVEWTNMRFSIVPLLALLSTFPQGTPKNSPSVDPLHLLNEVSQQYANARSFHVGAVEERRSSANLYRDWQKTVMTAILMPGGRYRYEGHSAFGSAILVSDGITQWDYHVRELRYTEQPVSAEVMAKRRLIPHEEDAATEAKDLVKDIGHLAGRLKSATLLADETIVVGGRRFECYVVRVGEDDFKTRSRYARREQTVWIDKASRVVKKIFTRTQVQPDRLPQGSYAFAGSTTTTTIYPVVELDQPQAASTFTFMPPPEAKLVGAFPDSFSKTLPDALDLVGKLAPELRLKSADGRITTLSSYRGKPVFIEFWATWCEPCVDLISDLMKLHAETEVKGLVWISIDNDEDPDSATTFISREHIPWSNYHDEDGSLGDAFHRQGIPLGVLLDAEGKVVFWQSGYGISDLRAAIAKLGPQFSSTALTGANRK